MLKRNSEFVSDSVYVQNQHVTSTEESEEFLDFRKIFQILQRRSRLIINCIIFALCLAVLYLIIATPKYSSKALLLIDPREKKVLSSEAVVSGLGTDSSAVESEVEIIKSRAIAERVIKKLNLGAEGESGIFSTLKSFIFAPTAQQQDIYNENIAQREKLLQSFAKSLDVQRKKRTYIIEVIYTSSDPQKAADIANAVSNAYLNEQLEAKFNLTRRASIWLKDKLAELREKVRVSEKKVEAYRIQNNLVEAGGKTLSEQQIAQLNTQLIDARAKTAGSQAKYKQAITMSRRGGQLSSLADALQSSVIAGLRTQLAEVGRKEAELKSRYGPKHPTVVNIQAEKRDIRKQIRSEVSRIIANLKNEFEVAKSREQSMADSLEELKQQNSVKNSASIKLRELQREAEAERAAFNALLSRFKETSAQETLQAADARIISTALPSSKPSSPKKAIVFLIAIIGGACIGIGFVFLKEYFDNAFRTATEIEQDLGIAHLASIPLMENGQGKVKKRAGSFGGFNLISKFKKTQKSKQNGLINNSGNIKRLVIENPLSQYAEAIRSLRVATKLSPVGPVPQVLMVASALPNEGKTTTALNLAHYASLAGERTLLIDADIRNPSLTSSYRPDASIGLLNILEGRVNFSDVCMIDNESGLHFLPNPNQVQLTQPSEILGSQPMAKLLEDLRASYDLIIVDVAPLLPVIDAQVLLPQIDKAVIVTEWGVTPKDAVYSALKPFRNYSEKLLGIALNKTVLEQMKYYQQYGSGGYYGQYGYTYGGQS